MSVIRTRTRYSLRGAEGAWPVYPETDVCAPLEWEQCRDQSSNRAWSTDLQPAPLTSPCAWENAPVRGCSEI